MIKRIVDILGALIGLVVLSPAMLLIAVLICRQLGRPVLFLQRRPGIHGKPFRILKFRTMLDAHSPDGELLPDTVRLTPLGRFLRSASLDELPELWNVLRGDMSLVGPRPLLMEYLSLYSSEQERRHEVRPGITGWAQVNGRNALSWEEKFAFDLWYVDHRSLWLDLRILLRTVIIAIRRDGINSSPNETMPPFMGNLDEDSGEIEIL